MQKVIKVDSEYINNIILKEMENLNKNSGDLCSYAFKFDGLFNRQKAKPSFINSYLDKTKTLSSFIENTFVILTNMIVDLEEFENNNEHLNEFEKVYNEHMVSMNAYPTSRASEMILSKALEVSNGLIDSFATYTNGDLYKGDIDKSMNYNKTCCATFVAVTLYKAGLVTSDEINNVKEGNYNYTPILCDFLETNPKFIEVPVDQIQPGDIAVESEKSHIQIYVGAKDGKYMWYSKGSDDSINKTTIPRKIDKVERVFRYIGPIPNKDDVSDN